VVGCDWKARPDVPLSLIPDVEKGEVFVDSLARKVSSGDGREGRLFLPGRLSLKKRGGRGTLKARKPYNVRVYRRIL
jgi:hypothetical protein